MNTLVSLTGNFSVDKLKKISSQVEFLASQLPLPVHKIYAGKNPKLYYRQIMVSNVARQDRQVEYDVMDVGDVDGMSHTTSIGNEHYSEEEVEKLRESMPSC